MSTSSPGLKILITHLTRMHEDRICAAGLTNSGEHIRPILAWNNLRRSDLLSNGGVFDIGAVVDLGEVERYGSPPEVEDHLFNLSGATYEQHLEPDVFWHWLERQAKRDYFECFGPELKPARASLRVAQGRGIASLGMIQARRPSTLMINDRGKFRLRSIEERRTMSLPVTDIRLYDHDGTTLRTSVVEWVNEQMAGGCLLTVGLSRAYQASESDEPAHWLQVNNIHLKGDPYWRTAP